MTDEATTQLFDSAFRARNRLVASILMVLASIAPFGLALLALPRVSTTGRDWPAWVVTVGAFVAAGVLTWAAQDRLALLGNGRLRRHLHRRLAQSPEADAGSRAVFVGFSPSDELLTWDGDTDLDVGLLFLNDSELVFRGDRFDWSLQRERVDRVELTPAPVGPCRILVYWHAPREAARALSLESREAGGLRGADRQTRALYQRMAEWFGEKTAPADEGACLGYPPTDRYGGRKAEELGHGSCAVTLSMTSITVLTVWYAASSLLRDMLYCHAILWSGFIFVGGAVLTRGLLQYLQHTSPPRGPRAANGRS
jgi:hypothetical protein